MENYLTILLNKFRTWKEAKVKQPLTRETAYVLSTIGKKGGHYSDITRDYQKYILRRIEAEAKWGHKYAYIEHSGMTPTDKNNIVKFLTELQYTICFINEDVMLLSWKYNPSDFNYDRKTKELNNSSTTI